jgi:hypothetical protein
MRRARGATRSAVPGDGRTLLSNFIGVVSRTWAFLQYLDACDSRRGSRTSCTATCAIRPAALSRRPVVQDSSETARVCAGAHLIHPRNRPRVKGRNRTSPSGVARSVGHSPSAVTARPTIRRLLRTLKAGSYRRIGLQTKRKDRALIERDDASDDGEICNTITLPFLPPPIRVREDRGGAARAQAFGRARTEGWAAWLLLLRARLRLRCRDAPLARADRDVAPDVAHEPAKGSRVVAAREP